MKQNYEGLMRQIEMGEDIKEYKSNLTVKDLEDIMGQLSKYKSNLSGGIIHLHTVHLFKEFCRANGGYKRLKHTNWQIYINSEVKEFIDRYERIFPEK